MFDYSNFAWQEPVLTELQGCLNLMGETEDPFVLRGESFDEATALDSIMLQFRITATKTVICVHLRNWDEGLTLTKRYRATKEKIACFFAHSHLITFAALVCHEQYRATMKRKYISWARSYERHLEKLSSRGALNASAFLLLLRAESAVYKADAIECKRLYELAIARLHELELLSFEALAKDRAGLTLLELGDKLSGEAYLVSSLEAYRRWGATTKIHQIEADMAFLL